MDKYKRYCLALNEKENDKFKQIKDKGFGIKKIFMQGLCTFNVVDEISVDGINKSGIMRNIPDEE